MTIRMIGDRAHLEGDWTLSGASRHIDSLTLSLQQLEAGTVKTLLIDCRRVSKTDASGLQLLHVWMECVRLRGVEPTLVNMPENIQQAL